MRVCRTYVRDTDRHRENPFSCFRIQSCRATKYRLWKQKQMLWFLQQLRRGLLQRWWHMRVCEQARMIFRVTSLSIFSFFLRIKLNFFYTLTLFHATPPSSNSSLPSSDCTNSAAQMPSDWCSLFLIKTWHIAYGAPRDDWLLVFKHSEICCGLPYWRQVYSKNCQERNHFKGCQSLWSHLWWERREVIGGWRNCSKNYINNELLPITLTSYKGESTCCFNLQTQCYLFLQIHSIPMHTCFPFGHRHSIPSSAVNERKRSSAFEMDFSRQIDCV